MRLSSALASDAAAGQGVLEPILCGVRAGAVVAAPASTVRITINDNIDVRRALQRGGLDGTILVIAGGSRSRSACMGGILARAIKDAGVVAVVTDAPVRDSSEIAELGLPVWSRGLSPLKPTKVGGGEVGVEVELAGVKVRPGDWVIADDDGIVVWPAERLEELRANAAEILIAEASAAKS